MTSANSRTADHPIDALFLERWSPRAFDGSAIPQADIDTLFDAARWAPSAFNYQPWRFLYAHRDSADWARLVAPPAPSEATAAVMGAITEKLDPR